jgi:hypothetical protein
MNKKEIYNLYKRRKNNYKNNILPKKTDQTKKKIEEIKIISSRKNSKNHLNIDKRYMNVYKK